MTEDEVVALCELVGRRAKLAYTTKGTHSLWDEGDFVSFAWLAWNSLEEKPDEVTGGLVWLLGRRLIDFVRKEDPQYRSWKNRGGTGKPYVLTDRLSKRGYRYEVVDPTGVVAAEDVFTEGSKGLRVRDRVMARQYFISRLTMKRIGALHGLTESRICQILSHRVLPQMRSNVRKGVLA